MSEVQKSEPTGKSSAMPRLIASLALTLVAFTVFMAATHLSQDSGLAALGGSGFYLLGLIGVAAGFAAVTLFVAGIVQMTNHSVTGEVSQLRTQVMQVGNSLRSINDRLLISDAAKRIAYREQDREALREAIREDIKKGEFDAAIALVEEMSQTYGYREEAEEFRDQIIEARADEQERRVTAAINELDRILSHHNWDKAHQVVGKIKRLFPDSPRAMNLDKRLRDAKQDYKRELERRFLEAADRDEVDLAWDLLRELDTYLTEAEAERFRETARGVIGKKRDNLGVQFKLAVQDHEWSTALVAGEQIMAEFPNSKMATEVRSMLPLLRERAAGQKAAAARPIV